jgi:hypothetical protein
MFCSIRCIMLVLFTEQLCEVLLELLSIISTVGRVGVAIKLSCEDFEHS